MVTITYGAKVCYKTLCFKQYHNLSKRKPIKRFQIEKIREYSKTRLHETHKPTPKPKVIKPRKKTFKKLKSLFLHFVKHHSNE